MVSYDAFGRFLAIQYDGTNVADFTTLVSGVLDPYSVPYQVSDVSGANLYVIVQPPGIPVTLQLQVGDWLVIRPLATASSTFEKLSNTTFIARYTSVIKLATDIAESGGSGAFGIANVPTLLGNSQTTVSVTIKPTLSAAPTDAVAILAGGVSLLASLSILSTTPVSGSQVDVVVRNTGLLSLSGASVFVHCA